MSEKTPLNAERWATIEMLSWRLMALSEEERSGALDHTRSTDPELAREVETLLTEWLADPDFLDDPVVARTPDAPEDLGAQTAIGPFRLVRPLGRGGMGEVYLAVEETEGVRRHVALKLIREGLDHATILDRFQTERRILAGLDHPGIARLYAVGSSDEGRPWLSMEYVDGVPITEYVRTHGLALPDRIDLVQRVCDALQHAHHRLVVHLDLKPANILVTPEGRPKLLDFGVAGAIKQGSGTGEGPSVGATPEYASPEQLRGDVPGVPSDIFSLGVLTYELLVGAPPDRSRADSVAPPSVHAPGISVDLDAVVLKALDPDADARYPTASSLSEDLARALGGWPVRARPRTRRYVASRFVGRHRLGVTAAVAAAVMLTGFSVVTAVQAGRIEAEAERVAQERDEALAVRSFLLQSFGARGPDVAGDGFTARQLLDGRAETLEAQYGDDPGLHAEMMGVLAEAYEQLGLLSDAEPLAREAVELRRQQMGPDDPDLPASLNALGWIIHQAGRIEEATPILREAVATARTTHEGDHPTTARALNDLGVNLEAQAAYEEAEAAYTESLDIRHRLLGDEDAVVAVTASNLSVVRYRQGDLEGAADMAGEAHDLFVRTLGPDHQRSMIVETNLAAMQAAAGDTEAARMTYRDILERRRRIFGDRHPNTAQTMTALATMMPAGELDSEAEALLREARSVQLEALGPDHPSVANTSRRLAMVLSRTDRADAATPFFEEALSIQREALGAAHPTVAETLGLLGASYSDTGDQQSAEDAYTLALGIQTEALGSEHPTTARTWVARAATRIDLGDLRGADRDLNRAWPALADAFDAGHLFLQEARIEWVRLHAAEGRAEMADSVLSELESRLTQEQRGLRVGRSAVKFREQLGGG